jgi:hypothetical protein
MSCPYFWPAEPRPSTSPRHIMLPLGDFWSGECRATAGQPWTPDDSHLHRLCNLGYARGACDRFPAANSPDTPDAVRFTISRVEGQLIHLYFVIERDHHPFAHGPLAYSTAEQSLVTGSSAGESLARQAEAYAGSYLRRKDA